MGTSTSGNLPGNKSCMFVSHAFMNGDGHIRQRWRAEKEVRTEAAVAVAAEETGGPGASGGVIHLDRSMCLE
jgi:hypothetical protein